MFARRRCPDKHCWEREHIERTKELAVLSTLLPANRREHRCGSIFGQRLARALGRANMSEGSKERSPQQLAKSRRGSLAQVKMLTVDERAQEVAKINKALGIKAPKDTAALDAARAA